MHKYSSQCLTLFRCSHIFFSKIFQLALPARKILQGIVVCNLKIFLFDMGRINPLNKINPVRFSTVQSQVRYQTQSCPTQNHFFKKKKSKIKLKRISRNNYLGGNGYSSKGGYSITNYKRRKVNSTWGKFTILHITNPSLSS